VFGGGKGTGHIQGNKTTKKDCQNTSKQAPKKNSKAVTKIGKNKTKTAAAATKTRRHNTNPVPFIY
jgi:hypothetical protein